MTEVVIRYRDMVLRLASRNCNSREDAEDVTQDVFFALLNRGIDFTDEAHLKAWLIRATIDRSKNTHRYIKRHPQTTYDPNIHDSEDKTTNHKESNMAIDCLKEEIAKLPPKTQNILRLYYKDSYSTKEIAQLEGIKESSIRAKLHRARKQLKEKLIAVTLIIIVSLIMVFPQLNTPTSIQAIDFNTVNQISASQLEVVAIQKDENYALVTFPVIVSWKADNIEWVSYSVNSETAYLYSPAKGKYVFFGGNNDHTAIQTTNDGSEMKLHLTVLISLSGTRNNNEVIQYEAKQALSNLEIVATAKLTNGTEMKSICTFS